MKQFFFILLTTISSTLVAGDAGLDRAYTCMRLGDFNCAAQIFEEHAKSGSAEAQLQLGKLYLSGRGVTRSEAAAKNWLLLAAEANRADAQYSLAILLLEENKTSEALHWLEKSAEQAYRPAALKLKALLDEETNAADRRDGGKMSQLDWHRAVVGCRNEEVLSGLKDGVKVSEVDKFKRSDLFYLVSCGDTANVAALLERGARPNTIDKYGESPLSLAVRKDEYRIAQLLLHAGAKPDYTSNSGNSLMHIAVKLASQPMVSTLLAANASTSLENEAGLTPVDIAANSQMTAIEKMLQKSGAKHSSNWSPTPTPSGEQTIRYLQSNHTESNHDNWSAAVQAIKHNQHKVLSALLNQHGAQLINAEDARQRTLLMYATEVSDIESIEILVGAGATVDRTNKAGTTALMTAATNNDRDCVLQLLSLGANPSLRDNKGRDSVHQALLAKHDKVARVVLETGSLDNTQTSAGNTYLMLAIQAQANKTIDWLLLQGNSQLELADKHDRTALWHSANSCNSRVFEQLLNHGANANTVDDKGYSLLHAALSKNCKPIVSEVLAQGADINLATQSGNTALMLAIQRGYNGTASTLLDHGADVSAQNKKGDTALLLAMRKQSPTSLLAQLLEAGGDAYRRNELGESAYSVAEASHPDALKLIKDTGRFKLFSF